MALGPWVRVDASAWVGDTQLTPATGLTGTVCIAQTCAQAAPINEANPNDLFTDMTVGSGPVTVRVKLTAPDGRTVDLTTTAESTLKKPFGSGCGGRPEIDLVVTKAGALEPAHTLKIG